jgi:uncharacterized protein YcnI
MNSPTPGTLKALAVAAATAGLMVFGAGAASAHVHVAPASTEAGGFSELTFRVPNEDPTAKTTAVAVTLPTETPVTSVSVRPMDGWAAQVIETALPAPVTVNGTTVTTAPTSVVWTADAAHQISQNEYQKFSISVGRLPGAGTTVLLPVAQTYSDGNVVNWNEPAVEGKEAPKKPAPSFVTTAAAGGHGSAPVVEPVAASETTPAVPTDTFASSWGWTGLGAGLLGLAAGVTALLRTRTARQN